MTQAEGSRTLFAEGAIGNPGGWTDERQKKVPEYKARIVQGLADGLFVSEICQALGISPKTVRDWRAQDKEFEEAYRDAEDAVTDQLEKAAIERAKDGILEPVVSKGEVVVDPRTGEPLMVRRYSDGLLQFLLRGRRQQVYGDRTKVEATHSFDPESAKLDVMKKLAGEQG